MNKNKMDEDGDILFSQGFMLCLHTFKLKMENYSFDHEMHQSKMV